MGTLLLYLATVCGSLSRAHGKGQVLALSTGAGDGHRGAWIDENEPLLELDLQGLRRGQGKKGVTTGAGDALGCPLLHIYHGAYTFLLRLVGVTPR